VFVTVPVDVVFMHAHTRSFHYATHRTKHAYGLIVLEQAKCVDYEIHSKIRAYESQKDVRQCDSPGVARSVQKYL